MRESLEHLDEYKIEEHPMTVEQIRRTGDHIGSFIIDIPELADGK